MSNITLEGISKSYGDLQAVDDVDLSIRDGELLCLLGPSGCGKSTTMRMISGLETPTSGEVYIGGENVTDQAAYDRDTSMVFQNWALFPYKTVLENVAFGLKMRGDGTDERQQKARDMLERVHMDGYEEHSPTDLSGGQKQRVALARSLAVDPDVLLLDEPLSNLDKRLREEMQIELKDIHKEFDKTFVYVTHNQNEAFTLADRIGIMNDGRLVQVGEPTEVYRNPTNRFVEEFLGDTNFVAGEVTDVNDQYGRLSTEFGATIRVPAADAVEPGASFTVSLRPEFMQIRRSNGANEREGTAARADGTGGDTVVGSVENTIYRGSSIRYVVDTGGEHLFVEQSVTDQTGIEEGEQVELGWNTDDILVFRPDGSRVRDE
ncbi:polyamine-transporting ATPase [Halobellus salinus]|uniref:Molybdate/tungstate import ATP-binding protein WtpC n=1 Tax=Halobellus salinus TaxID=931585 RepID=A0A830ELC7_9EURY|nr:ABC transporter ATP-binding protein [Halobellus salinus]GGI94494.1 polyamine-transporting ATPase [Halobellus salinus]SMP20005.1 spermidine/putrescine transport system ATP-binding protein [Halobellus salinus]